MTTKTVREVTGFTTWADADMTSIEDDWLTSKRLEHHATTGQEVEITSLLTEEAETTEEVKETTPISSSSSRSVQTSAGALNARDDDTSIRTSALTSQASVQRHMPSKLPNIDLKISNLTPF